MPTDFIFAYGSNMNRSDMRSWLEAGGYDSSLIVEMSPATLEGYQYVWNFYSQGRGGGTANLEPKDHGIVWGALIEIEDSLVKAFDRKQGHPYFYSRGDRRIPVVRQPQAATIQAWVYLAGSNRQTRRDVWPTREYKKILLDAAAFWEFPEEYMEKMRSWLTA